MKPFSIFTLLSGFILIVPYSQAFGQAYRMEAGLSGGGSFYMGDANQTSLFKDTRPSFGMFWRYNYNGRFALKANADICGIEGTTVGDAYKYPDGRELKFSHNLIDAGVRVEFNFYEYGMPSYTSGSSWISPYVSFGVGMTGYKSDKNKVCANLPFGLGVKMKVLPRVNVGMEWSFRKSFADDLDYSDYGGAFQLSDPWQVKSAYDKNKDWYSTLSLSVSYDLYGTGSKCFEGI